VGGARELGEAAVDDLMDSESGGAAVLHLPWDQSSSGLL